MTLKTLKADGRRKTVTGHWNEWLSEADRMYSKYVQELDFAPFDYTEVAAVGFLSCAAARRDFVSLNEYQVRKHDRTDRRFRVAGRADLWLSKDGIDYSFEFKRAWYDSTEGNLISMLDVVRKDIQCVPRDESDYAAGGLLAYVNDKNREPIFEKFALHEDVDMAYRIGPNGEGGAYLFFSFRD